MVKELTGELREMAMDSWRCLSKLKLPTDDSCAVARSKRGRVWKYKSVVMDVMAFK